jgi:hypothetical protein
LKLVELEVAGIGNPQHKLLVLWATAVRCPNSKKHVGLLHTLEKHVLGQSGNFLCWPGEKGKKRKFLAAFSYDKKRQPL